MFDRAGNRKYLNRSERNAFLASVISDADPLRKAFCLTLFYTGCRLSEALNLKHGQIDLANRSLIFETLKRRARGCFRAVPIPDDLLRLVIKITNETEPPNIWPYSR